MTKTGVNKKCLQCEAVIYVPAWLEKQGGGKHCSPQCQYKSKLGKATWNKGMKMPFMNRKMKDGFIPVKAFKKGNEPWNKGLVGAVKAWNKGLGMTPLELRVRWSSEYKAWRKAVFERDDYSCIWCGAKETELHADHIKAFSKYPDLRVDISNGRTLCKPCHIKTDTWGGFSRA